jgi:hypothetical protein
MSRQKAGYGNKTRNGRSIGAHRWVVAQIHGWEAIEGKDVMHLCDNPPCFRYDHLAIGTHAENMAMSHARGRSSTIGIQKFGVEHHNAKLTPETVKEARLRWEGGESCPSIAKDLGVSRATIRRAVIGETWGHVR